MRKKIKFLLASGGTALAYLSSAGMVFAQNINLRPGGIAQNIQNITIAGLVSVVIRVILLAAFVIAFIFLLIGGIRWILAGGDKAAAESARGTLTAAIIGLIIVLSAWALMFFIEKVFGVTIISGQIGIPNAFQ